MILKSKSGREKIILIMILLLFNIYFTTATSNIISSNPIDICGDYVSTTTIQSEVLINSGLLETVEAELLVPAGSNIAVDEINQFFNVSSQSLTTLDINWNIECDENYPGEYAVFVNFYVNHSLGYDTDSNILTVNVHSNIDSSPPNIIESSPIGVITQKSVPILVKTDEDSTCRYDTSDKDYQQMSYLMQGSEKEHNDIRLLQDGTHVFYVRCIDTNGNQMVSSETITFSLDSTAPQITSSGPSGIVSDTILLEIRTNEKATCRYSEAVNTDYQNMDKLMTTNDNLFHYRDITLGKDGLYEYFVKCKDIYGNINENDWIIQFEVDSPPTARISLSESSPLKSGIVKIELITSEKVISPKLTYILNEEGERNIPLEGSGSSWEGMMILDESDASKIGSFKFEAKDLSGNVGTTITQGAVFIVDSKKPKKIDILTAKVTLNQIIILEWYYEEDVDFYKIYRSTNPDVTKLNFYTNAYKKDFTDYSLERGKTYYYKISAVDEAGNEAELSPEVYASIQEIVNIEKKELEPAFFPMVEKSKKSIDELILEIKNYELELDENWDIELEIPKTLESIINKLEQIKTELESLKKQDINKDKLQLELDKIDLKVRSELKNIPIETKVVDEKITKSNPSTEEIKSSVSNILNILRLDNIDENNKQSLIENSIEIQNEYEITNTIKKVLVTYKDESTKEFIIVTKEIIGDLSNKGYSMVEIIPKSFATSITDITFKIKNYDIIEKDPILRWKFSDIPNGKLSYYIENNKDLNRLDNIQSVIVDDPQAYITKTLEEEIPTQKITGLLFKPIESRPHVSQIGIVIGLLMLSILMIYYFFIQPETIKTLKNDVNAIKEKISEAHFHFDENNHAEAKQLYRHVEKAYHKLSEKEKSLVYDELLDLYHRYKGKNDTKPLLLHNGMVIRNMYKLIHALKEIEDHDFYKNLQIYRRDICLWLDSIGKHELSKLVSEQRTKSGIHTILYNNFVSDNDR